MRTELSDRRERARSGCRLSLLLTAGTGLACCPPQACGRIFALFLLILCAGLTACGSVYFEPIITDEQLCGHLKEIYREDFRIIVENDGEEIIIDGETSDLSAAGQGFPVSVPARLSGTVGREFYSSRL